MVAMRAAGACVLIAAVASACAPMTATSTAATSTAATATVATATATTSTAATATAATASAGVPVVRAERFGRLGFSDRQVRVALAGKAASASVSATTRWMVDEQGGDRALVRGTGGERWRVEQNEGLLRIAGDGGDATPWREGPLVARPSDTNGLVQFDGHRYRGELWFTATDTGILVVNRLPVEEYLRGVLPLELGTRLVADKAALEAQAIAARSYTYARVPANADRGVEIIPAAGWHVVATVMSQMYGGADVEHTLANEAVDATAGLVLRYGGLIVDAPYSSSCGGRSATPRDAWRDVSEESYLQSVDDTDPTTGRPYCDISPRNHWVEELDETQLQAVVGRALVAAGARSPGGPAIQEMRVAQRTGSGRVGTFTIRTDRGDVNIRANDLRTVFRTPRGAILSSTNFSVDRESRSRGHLTGVTLRGAGNGHGVGMCQWGAIGRSRAGQDARTILRFYYPGTVVGIAD